MLQISNTTNKPVKYKQNRLIAQLEEVILTDMTTDIGRPNTICNVTERIEAEQEDFEANLALSLVNRIQSQTVSAINTPVQRQLILDSILPHANLFDDRILGSTIQGKDS